MYIKMSIKYSPLNNFDIKTITSENVNKEHAVKLSANLRKSISARGCFSGMRRSKEK